MASVCLVLLPFDEQYKLVIFTLTGGVRRETERVLRSMLPINDDDTLTLM